MNQTLFERCRDTYGCGVNFPENRTIGECMDEVYTERKKNINPDELKSILNEISNKFQSSLPTDIEGSKVKQIECIVHKVVLGYSSNLKIPLVSIRCFPKVCLKLIHYFFYRWIYWFQYLMRMQIYQKLMHVTS